ncbi:hypothetical protein DCAR_0313230 [Daucus carota subsp. sativus]|uniref:Uncharacterized protein n=1 Tax=Daucus carota subsp. sativus TaxID=79200 RepID=A0A162ALQ9_DAUCS|nr:hypothetical protein DCAR_0313230 [Daucus carota subsp. sativus]
MSEFVCWKQHLHSKYSIIYLLWYPVAVSGYQQQTSNAGACAGIITMSATYPLDMVPLIKPSVYSWNSWRLKHVIW